MDYYFQLAGYKYVAKGILGCAKLKGSAKTWWKCSFQISVVSKSAQGWEEVKDQLKERYLPLNYSTSKMNEFLSYTRRDRPIDVYYEEFIKLSRRTPSHEKGLRQIIQVLEGNLADEVESLRPILFLDALIQAKSKLSSVQKKAAIGEKRKAPPFQLPQHFRQQRVFQPQVGSFVGSPPCRIFNQVTPMRTNLAAVAPIYLGIQCCKCCEWGHKNVNCPQEDPPRPSYPA